MTRVLHIVNSLDPGGMENGVCNIAAGLAPLGFLTHVACLEKRGAFAERLPLPQNVRVLGKRGGFSPLAAFTLWRVIRAMRPHIIHTHNLGPLIYASLATLGGRTRAIIHGEHAQLAPWEMEPRRLRQRKKYFHAARAIHTVSQDQLDELLALGFPAKKLSAIPNGVDTERFHPDDSAAAKAALGIPADATVLGLVGRFGPFKRHGALLAAFAEIAADFPRAHLVFLGGGGSEESRVSALASASPHAARIHLPGFHPDPAAIYRAFDLLVIPSINEGMSNAVLEAMACAVPVLGNLGCGHDQIITTGADGILADLSTPESMAGELRTLLATPARLVDMGRAARITVTSQFSLTAMLAAYEQLYRAHAR